MHIAEIYFRRYICPITQITQLEPHILHKYRNLFIGNTHSSNERLLHNHLEIAFRGSAKTNDRQTSLREISIMERNTVQSQNRLNIIIKPYRLNQCRSIIINTCLSPFGNLFPKHIRQNLIHPVNPDANSLCPTLYPLSLLRSTLAFSFEIVVSFSILICISFCSREQGCNDI